MPTELARRPLTTHRFDAIGTAWRVDTPHVLDDPARTAIDRVVADYDADWSRFRDDSFVADVARSAGTHRLPATATPLLALYRDLYELTDGAVSPLVGGILERLGYGRTIDLVPTGAPLGAPAFHDALAWDGMLLQAPRPVSIDVGAAGKGQLVELVSRELDALGHPAHVVDASGDLVARGVVTRVALEHPADPRRAVGVVEVADRALAASAVNRRAWGRGLHHVVDARTGVPTTRIVATWAFAADAMTADGLATALFFAEPDRLAERFDFDWVRITADGRLDRSPTLDGEFFA